MGTTQLSSMHEQKDTGVSAPVCIAGMHRSGTSMVARLLNVCGLYLGNEEHLMHPNHENPEGFWENVRFVSLNEEILAILKGGWDFPPNLSPGWFESGELDPLKEKTKSLIDEFAEKGTWGWKDPRNSITIDYWKSAIPSLKVIVCVRNPLEVVKSLHKRGFSSKAFGFNLWWAYNESLLSSLHTDQYIITHYESYFINPLAELRRVASFASLAASEEQLKQAASTIKTSLRRNLAYNETLPKNVESLYERLCAEAGPVFLQASKKDVSPHAAYEHAHQLIANGMIDDGKRTLEHLIRDYPEFALAHNDLGVLFTKSGNTELALNHHKTAVRLEPQNALFLRNLADFYFMKLGDYPNALRIYNDLLSKQPADAELLFALGLLKIAQEKTDEGCFYFSRVLQLQPDHAGALQALDILDKKENRTGQAKDISGSKEEAPLKFGNDMTHSETASRATVVSDTNVQLVKVCREPIFVIGAPRSGTSVLSHSLARHSLTWLGQESDFMGPFFRDAQKEYQFGTTRGKFHWLSSQEITIDEFLEHAGIGINALYTRQSSGKRWIEQTPEYTLYLDLLVNAFPKAKFINIIRDGRDVVTSMINSGFDQPFARDFEVACKKWLTFVAAALEFEKKHPDRIFHVFHERLIEDSISEFKSICLFLGLSYEDKISELFQSGNRMNSSFENGHRRSWQNSWSEEQKATFDQICGTMLRALGYGTNNSITSGKKSERMDSKEQQGIGREEAAKDWAKVMKEDWNKRASEDARYYIRSTSRGQTEEEFDESGRINAQQLIINELSFITSGKDPGKMKVLEIGCGIGRVTKHLANIFGEVHGIDVSGEMIENAKKRLGHINNIHFIEGSGQDLAMFSDAFFDFVFSFIVFQHIPSRDVIFNYITETHRALKPGGIFKFQVQGCTDPAWLKAKKDTWHGVTITEDDIRHLSSKLGFDVVAKYGQGTQYSFYTLRKLAS